MRRMRAREKKTILNSAHFCLCKCGCCLCSVEALKEKDPAEFERQCALAKHQSTTGERVVARQTDEYGNVVYHRPAVDYNLFLSADHIELNGKMGKGGVGKTEAKLAKIRSMKKASQN